MLQHVRCIKFGEILLDENRQLLLLCSNCLTDFEDLHRFRQHLDFCGATDVAEAPMHGIFERNASLLFPNCSIGTNGAVDQQILGRYAKGNKEFIIYKFNGVKKLETLRTKQQHKRSKHDNEFMDLIKIEEELLDPRWYTDDKVMDSTPHHSSLASYNELVEAVTPFVQFKENVKTNGGQNKYHALKTPAATQLPMRKPKNDYILNDKSPSLNTVKATTGKVFGNEKKRRLSYEKQNKAIETETTTTLANTSRIIKLPVEMLKIKRSIEPVELVISDASTQQKLPLQRHQQRIDSCNSTKNLTQVKSKMKPFPNKTESTATKQCEIVPTLSDTKLIIKHTPSLTLNFGAVQPSPAAEVNAATLTVASTAINTPANSMQTEQILNKLQNLGLQVKRKLPNLSHQDHLASSIYNTANEKTLELLRKLQSKGMKVKIVQNASSSQRPALGNGFDKKNIPKLENTNGHIEPTSLNSTTNKLNLIWPQ